MPYDGITPPKFEPSKLRPPRLQPPREALADADLQNASSAEPEGQKRDAISSVAHPPLQAPSTTMIATRNPLGRFSLRGKADEIEAKAADAKPLLGKFLIQGQATMIYAAPNTGKTLIVLKLCLDAIEAGRIDPGNLYYLNADDSSAGLAVKLRLLQDAGAHMLAPGFEGLKLDDLAAGLIQAVEEDAARGTCVVLDTLKKFTDLMDKKRASAFAEICRQYVRVGGTIIALGHTAKSPNSDGTPRYQGTTDILEDFDAVYVGQPMASNSDSEVRGAKFTRLKCRADSPEVVAYAYAATEGISYAEKLASITPVDDLSDYDTENDEVSDPPVMDAIVRLIEAGSNRGQMQLAKAVAKECGVSHRAALQVLNRYTGDVPNEHLWNYDTGPRGVRIYRLIDQTKRDI